MADISNSNNRGKYLLIALLLLLPLCINGQNFTIKSYTTSDGLAHNNVRAIARDSSGFLWLGTWDGLSRFNGHEFVNFFHEPDDSTSIPYFSITELEVDRKNNLWIVTDTRRELVLYNRSSENFTTLYTLDGIPLKFLGSISIDESGNLVILVRDKIIIKDPDKKNCVIYNLLSTDNSAYIAESRKYSVSFQGNSELWIIGDKARLFRKGQNNSFVLSKEYPLIRISPLYDVYFDQIEWQEYYESANGDKWIFSSDGLFRYDGRKEAFIEYNGEIHVNQFTGKKFFYWGTRGKGIYYLDSKGQKLFFMPEAKSNWLLSIIPDSKNSFWFSNVSTKGVPLGFSLAVIIPGIFRNTVVNSPDSTSPALYSVIMDKDRNIWTGIRGFDHIVQYRPDGTVTGIDYMSKNDLSKYGYIRSLIPAENGIWVGYYSNLLQFYDYKTRHFIEHKANAQSYRSLTVNHAGNLYIGTNEITEYNPSSSASKILWPKDVSVSVFRLYVDSSGIIWAGMSDSRLLRCNSATGESSIIKVTPGITNIEDIIPGENGDLWLALLGKGVCRYNTVNGTFKYYTSSKGLSNNTTYCLLRDGQGHIWVSTNNGISMIHPETGKIRTFDETDGIAISEFNSGAKFRTDDGEFIFGGMGGFVRFYPDSISLNTASIQKQKVLLTSFRVSGGPKYLPEPLNTTDTIFLDKNENNFHLFFSSTDFVNSNKTLYRYKLSGVNKNWIVTNSQTRNINYSNLSPGWYNLVIEATDLNGDWVASRQIAIRIKPSFYQTRSFRILVPLTILLIIVYSIILYIRQIKQEERSKQDELKLQSLRSQMNPHFIFNSLNSINYFISNNDRLSANRYIGDFSRLIRSILSNMGSNFIPFEDEINSIRDYLRIEHLRFSDKFDYSIDTADISNIFDIEVCPGIVQPFIENAIWHGVRALEDRKGQINIRFEPAGVEGLRCIIEDDGIGRMASINNKGKTWTHKPKGISIIEERLQITGKLRKINYKLEMSDLYPDKQFTGTRVVVDLPARQNKIRT
jgi:ligand-binding sensor domain-containing protein